MKKDILDAIPTSLTASQIADKFGVSRQYVYLLAKQAGLRTYQPAKIVKLKTKVKRQIDPLREQKQKFYSHRYRANQRGIEFHLSFDEWWQLWEPHYEKMGREKGCMCMCRTLDKGGYAVGNVRIDLVQNNGHERRVSNLAKNGTRWMKSGGTARHLPNNSMCQQKLISEYSELD